MVSKKVDALIEALKEYSPDYVLSDLGILGCLAARIMGIPLITINQSCYHPNVAGGRLLWWEEENDFEEPILDKINTYLSQKGVKKLDKFTEIFTGELTLIPSFPEFDPINNLNQYNTHYIGPVLWNTGSNADKEIIHFFEHDNSTIFCYTARFRDNVGESGKKIFEVIFEGAKYMNARIIISTGSQADYEEAMRIVGNNMPDSIKICEYIPLDIAYGMSDMVVHHGGHGSCLAQFYYGVPSVIIPTHREREYNARMCKKLGISEFILREELVGAGLGQAVNKVLGNADYKKAAEQWKNKEKAKFNNLDSVITLVEKI